MQSVETFNLTKIKIECLNFDSLLKKKTIK